MDRLVLLLIIVGTLVGGWFYVSHLQEQLKVSEINNAKLEQSIETQKEAFENIKKEVAQIQKINSDLSVQNERMRKDANALRSKFSSRDLGLFMETDPMKAQTVINNATERALRCIELASGAELTEKERNAKTPEEANRDCPSLIKR
jgi:cell division septum initiation protein DivIVA